VSVIIARSLHAHPASTGLKGERPFLVFTKKQKRIYKEPAAHWASHMELILDVGPK